MNVPQNISKGKDKNHRIISTDPGKAFHTIQYSFIINTSQSGDGGNLSQHNKSYAGPTQSKHNTQLGQADSPPTKILEKKGSPLACLPFTMGLEVLPAAISQETEMKGIQVGSRETCLSWYASDMILQRQHPKDATYQLQLTALVNKFSKIAEYKIYV